MLRFILLSVFLCLFLGVIPSSQAQSGDEFSITFTEVTEVRRGIRGGATGTLALDIKGNSENGSERVLVYHNPSAGAATVAAMNQCTNMAKKYLLKNKNLLLKINGYGTLGSGVQVNLDSDDEVSCTLISARLTR